MLPNHLSEPTVVDLLQARASARGDHQAFRFISGHGGEEPSLTYRALHQRAMAIGGELQTLAGPGRARAVAVSARLGFRHRVFRLPVCRASSPCRPPRRAAIG